MKNDKEEWKPVPETNGDFEVSNHGLVRNTRTGRIKISSKHAQGYRLVQLYTNRPDKSIQRSLHSVVAECFIGPRPFGLVICHNDGDPTNNRADNLRYDTQSANMLEAYHKHGTVAKRGEDCVRAKITNKDVREIRKRIARGDVLVRIAESYSITSSAISDIKSGRRWGHVV